MPLRLQQRSQLLISTGEGEGEIKKERKRERDEISATMGTRKDEIVGRRNERLFTRKKANPLKAEAEQSTREKRKARGIV